VRKETDTCPDWQCPGCGAAYNKVKVQPDNKRMSCEELHRRDVEDLQKMRERKRQIGLLRSIKEHPVLSGISLGVMTFANGIGTACSAANPLLKIAGIVILVGSIVYGLSQFWS
jgi:hypothetical protein